MKKISVHAKGKDARIVQWLSPSVKNLKRMSLSKLVPARRANLYAIAGHWQANQLASRVRLQAIGVSRRVEACPSILDIRASFSTNFQLRYSVVTVKRCFL